MSNEVLFLGFWVTNVANRPIQTGLQLRLVNLFPDDANRRKLNKILSRLPADVSETWVSKGLSFRIQSSILIYIHFLGIDLLYLNIIESYFSLNMLTVNTPQTTKDSLIVAMVSGRTMYNIQHVPDLLRIIGCGLMNPILQSWDDLVNTEVTRRAGIGVDASTSGDNISSGASVAHASTTSDAGSRDVDSMSQISGLLSEDPLPDIDWADSFSISSSSKSTFSRKRGLEVSQNQSDQHERAASTSVGCDLTWLDDSKELVVSTKRQKVLHDLALSTPVDQKAHFQTLSPDDVGHHWFQQLAVIRDQARSLTQARSNLKKKSQQVRRLQTQLVKTKAELDQMNQPTTSLDIVRKGRCLTWRTSVILGLRKLMAVVSANAFPLATLINVSRWTVTRCEIVAWAVILGRWRSWHETVMSLLKSVSSTTQTLGTSEALVPCSVVDDRSFSRKRQLQHVEIVITQDDAIRKDHELPSVDEWLSCLNVTADDLPDLEWQGTIGSTFFASDATNSSIWQRQKLQGLEVRSVVLINRRALKVEKYDDAFNILKCMFLCQQMSSVNNVNKPKKVTKLLLLLLDYIIYIIY